MPTYGANAFNGSLDIIERQRLFGLLQPLHAPLIIFAALGVEFAHGVLRLNDRVRYRALPRELFDELWRPTATCAHGLLDVGSLDTE